VLLKSHFGKEASNDLSGDHLLSSKTHALLDEPWRPFLVMERAAASLEDVLRDLRTAREKLPLPLIQQLVSGATRGLQRLHETHHLIHDDVKPGNLFLRLPDHGVYEGPATLPEHKFEVAVGDFGFARKIGEARPFPFGEDGYKAPEQKRPNQAADPRTDLFGLGRVLEEFLKHSADPVPPWLDRLVKQCKQPDLASRPVSAKAVAWELSSQRGQFRHFGIEREKHSPFVQRPRAAAAFEQFRRDAHLAILHLKGDPGTGKTALLTHWADQVAPGAAYFLSCTGRASLEMALRDLLQALGKAFDIALDLPNNLDQWGVREALTTIVRAPDRPVPPGAALFLYVDALDEADRPFDVARLLPTDLPDGVKLVLSSRHEPRFDHLEEAPRRLEVLLDAPADRQQNLDDATTFCRQRTAEALSEAECKEIARVLEANFQRIGIYCDYLSEQYEKGELDHQRLQQELEELGRDFTGGTGGEEAFHRFYRKYVWDVALRACGHEPGRVNLLTQLAGLLAVAEAPVPVGVLAELTGLDGDDTVEAALLPLRRNLRCALVRGPGSREELPAYRYAHKTIQTFIVGSHGPLRGSDSDRARRYRGQVLDHYRGRPPGRWDHFGLGAFVRLCLRQQREDWAAEAVTNPEFIQTIVAARQTTGLGVDGLREMVARIREVVEDETISE
jgi:hypothetical protein